MHNLSTHILPLLFDKQEKLAGIKLRLALVATLSICTVSLFASDGDSLNASASWQGAAPTFAVPATDNTDNYNWTIWLAKAKADNQCQPSKTVKYDTETQQFNLMGLSFNDSISHVMHDFMKLQNGYYGGFSKLQVTNKQTGSVCDFLAHNNLSQYKNGETVTLTPETCNAGL